MKQIRSEDLGDVTDYFESIQFSVFSQEGPLNGQIDEPTMEIPLQGNWFIHDGSTFGAIPARV